MVIVEQRHVHESESKKKKKKKRKKKKKSENALYSIQRVLSITRMTRFRKFFGDRKSHDYDSKKKKNEEEKFEYNACNDKKGKKK